MKNWFFKNINKTENFWINYLPRKRGHKLIKSKMKRETFQDIEEIPKTIRP